MGKNLFTNLLSRFEQNLHNSKFDAITAMAITAMAPLQGVVKLVQIYFFVLCIGVKVWNCIPLKIRKLSKNTFKKEIKSTLRDIFCEEDSYLDTPSIIKKLNKQKK